MTRNDTRQGELPHHGSALASDAGKPGETTNEPSRQRIAKAMARAGLCSRREAEAWVLAGRVEVNGETLASPARDVGPDDSVLVDGAPLPLAEKTRLFLFHKPRGLVTSDRDPEGRETVADFLHENWPEGPRVVTVGRLDINTEGLLLLTNDGGLARTLELPETGWTRRYRVRARGQADQAALDALADGISIDGIDYAGLEAKLDRVQGSNCWLTMALREGKNREIKKILEHLGLEVNRLIRMSFGPFQLLDLPEGAVEEVRSRVLRDQLGAALAAQAGVDFGDNGGEPAARPDKALRPAPVESNRKPRPAGKERGYRERGDAGAASREVPSRQEGSQRAPDGARRHVSASRAMNERNVQLGPRKRIERSDTKDRRDRTIAVERHVRSGETPRRDGARHQSPSAEAKRARIARSGAPAAGRSRHAEDASAGRHTRSDHGTGARRFARAAPGGGSRDRRDHAHSGDARATNREEGARDRRTRTERSEPRERRDEAGRAERAGAGRRPAPSGDRSQQGGRGRPSDGNGERGRAPRKPGAPHGPRAGRPPARSGQPPRTPRGGGGGPRSPKR